MELGDVSKSLTRALSKAWELALKELLESKHLYQKTVVDLDTELASHKLKLKSSTDQALLAKTYSRISIDPIAVGTVLQAARGTYEIFNVTLVLSNVKLFCAKCDRIEAYMPVAFKDLSADHAGNRYFCFDNVQIFALSYRCQSCRGTPETFLVSRRGSSLRLEGRSPMESVDVPNYIPKIESKYFRDALIAMNSGKTLAAFIYLRTFIEQVARRVTGMKKRETGDAILAEYGSRLPQKYRDLMPSLREFYGKISEALHDAREDVELFKSAIEQIQRHFEIRKVFDIPE